MLDGEIPAQGFMSIRVLHIINGDLYSGAERVQDLLALSLPKLGCDVGVVCLKPGQFVERRQATETPLYPLPMSSRFDISPAIKVAKIIRRERYDLVHTHTPRAALVGQLASRITGSPMVHHIHSPTGRDTEDSRRNRVNWQIEKLSLIGVKRLIPVSSSLSRYLIAEGFDQRRIRVVPNGVPTPGPLLNRRAPSAEWIIGTVALFRPRKGIEILIEALAMLRAEGRRLRIRAVGPFDTPEYESSVMKIADQAGVSADIDWTGFTRDVNAELSGMDLFVLPSLYGEGMPMVILEAMAIGVPVVATDVEGIPEVLEQGRCGLLVPAGSAAALAQAIAGAIDGTHDWQSLRERAWERQSEAFSDLSMARGVAQVYREVLDRG